MYSGEYDACDVTLSVYPHRAGVGSIPSVAGIFFKPARCGYTLRVTSQASYSPEYITPTQENYHNQHVKFVSWFASTNFKCQILN